MHSDRPILGILLMVGFCALAPLGDSLAKLLGSRISLGEIVLVRFALQTVILLPIIRLTGRKLGLRRSDWGLMIFRSALHIVGISAMFLALRYLPLAEALAIAFVEPFLLLLLGAYVLKETVGVRRLVACAVGFAGTLLVIQPSFAAVGWAALLPLLVAIVFALFIMTTRQLATRSDPIVLQAISGALAFLLLLPAIAFGQSIPALALIWPDSGTLWLLLALGFVGTFAHLLMTWSLRHAPSATLAPIQYLELPFATLIGWLVFRDIPNDVAALGIVVSMAAGLYIVLRERAQGHEVVPQEPPV